MSDTPETDKFRASLDGMREINQRDRLLSHARKLERERDQWVAKAAELSAERESNAMQALAYKAERDKALERADTMFAKYADILDHVRNERDEARKLFESSKRARASLSEACDHLQRELDALHAAIRNLRDVQGRYHTQIATERLFALLPEVSSQPEA